MVQTNLTPWQVYELTNIWEAAMPVDYALAIISAPDELIRKVWDALDYFNDIAG